MSQLYQKLPSVDRLLSQKQGIELISNFGRTAVLTQCRLLLDIARKQIRQQNALPFYCRDEEDFYTELAKNLTQQRQIQMLPVQNLTGTVLHTNLGRAIWAESAQQAALQAMQQPVALEFDLKQGKRGHRDLAVSRLLADLTGAEAACIVNNNAAAVLLLLATFASGKEVVISRGELIEIGGAFRIPDIMTQAGCRLVEVGTTNRTHLSDYANAITENTAFFLKVHSSNYQIVGFTHSVEERELVALGREKGIPVISDLGSGALIDLTQYNLPSEPTVQSRIKQGVDLVCFSGDKLLGGPQAGIIVGKKTLIDQLQSHPLKRALRCDKVILSGLEATLRLYLEPENLPQTLPTLARLTAPLFALEQSAIQLQRVLHHKLSDRFEIKIEPSQAQIGSGSQPLAKLPSISVTLQAKVAKSRDLLELVEKLKALPVPLIGRIETDKLWLDCRSWNTSQSSFNQVLQGIEQL